MKKFFTELMEVLSAVLLSSFIVYSVFTKIIGTPKDIKSIESNVVITKNKVDTISQKQNSIEEGINKIESTQVDVSQRLYENNYLLKQNSQELQKLEKIMIATKKEIENNK
jgi:septal ring factor EnvC (AmiA/AmiB activator)